MSDTLRSALLYWTHVTETKDFLMSQLLLNYLSLSQEDSIEQLNLTRRSFNALSRSGVRTVGEVARLVESGKIQTIRGLGRKGRICGVHPPSRN